MGNFDLLAALRFLPDRHKKISRGNYTRDTSHCAKFCSGWIGGFISSRATCTPIFVYSAVLRGFFLSPLAKTPASGFISSAIEGTVLNRDVAFSVRAN